MLFDDGAVTPGGLVIACVDCARFDPADHVARALALASMAPYGMVLCLAAIVYATRHRETATVLAAGCVNEALSLALKKALRQPRPAARCALLDTCGRAGMPSSHAQSVVFAVAVHAVLAFGVRPAAALESVALTVAAAAVCGARVYLGYHTPAQVAVGAALGAALGVGVGRAVKAGRKGGRRRAKRG